MATRMAWTSTPEKYKSVVVQIRASLARGREVMRLPAPVAAVSNEVAAVALVISALALGAQSSAPG